VCLVGSALYSVLLGLIILQLADVACLGCFDLIVFESGVVVYFVAFFCFGVLFLYFCCELFVVCL